MRMGDSYDYAMGFDEVELLHGRFVMSNPVEEWRPISGEPGYEVSNNGEVRSWKPLRNKAPVPEKARILKKRVNRYGYFTVVLLQSGRRKTYTVSALVCSAWGGNRPDGCVVRHLNGVRSDDRAVNLAWATPKENSRDSKLHGTYIHGESVNTAKLTNEKVMEIFNMNGTCAEIAEKFGVTFGTVSHIKNRRTWKHVSR